MANPEHLKILKKGVDVWNKWRKDNPKIIPDLSEAILASINLSKVNLTRAHLQNANLKFADLSCSDLSGAELTGTDLTQAVLDDADLKWAKLQRTIFTWTKLRGADLRAADIRGTKLSEADLSGATMLNAIIGNTVFVNLDMSEIIGLEKISHLSPSTISISTLYNSKGKIPEVFLRGAGIPENLIQILPTLVNPEKPIEFYSCFISYNHDDKSFARRLHDTLQMRGIRCWLDEKKLLPGDDIFDMVDRGIRLWDKILLCASIHSLKNSWWVDKEIRKALDKEKTLFEQQGKNVLSIIPLNLDKFMFRDEWASPYREQIRGRFAANFVDWDKDNTIFETAVEKVIEALRTKREDFE